MTLPDLPPVAPPGLDYLITPPVPAPSGWLMALIEFVGRLFGL